MSKSGVKHLAIILDGNRRWAKRRGLPSHRGHQAGVAALERTVKACLKQGIEYLTVFGFSTENWRRSKREVEALLVVMEKALDQYVDLLDREKVRLKIIGRSKDFPKTLHSRLDQAVARLQHHQRGTLTVALSYGGRDEIIRAAQKVRGKGGLDENSFAKFLDTADLPDPDMIIRTGGRMRLSNFLLWQGAYSELYFTKTLWPDFGASHLARAVRSFDERQRNFGQ